MRMLLLQLQMDAEQVREINRTVLRKMELQRDECQTETTPSQLTLYLAPGLHRSMTSS